MYAIERTTTYALSFQNERQSSVPAPLRFVAWAGTKLFRRRKSSSTNTATIVTGTTANTEPCRPHTATNPAANVGPMAKPTLPPTMNQRIPVAFFSPAT
jgi:hypothetical protein